MSLMIPDFSALIQNHVLARQSANIAQYGTKADVYFQLKQYLAHPLSGRSAYERIAGITPPQHSLSKSDEQNSWKEQPANRQMGIERD